MYEFLNRPITIPWRRPKSAPPRKFSRVTPTAHLAEFRGILNAAPWAEHHLWCGRVTPEQGRELRAQGFSVLGGGTLPTHSIFCVARLASAHDKTRFCFGVYTALSWNPDNRIAPTESFMDALAERLTTRLAQYLTKSTDPGFVLRCFDDFEYPWCLAPKIFEENIELEVGAHYRNLTKVIEL